MKTIILITLSCLALVACKKEDDTPVVPVVEYSFNTYQDTVFTYLERSADGVYHVANNSSQPLYERYYFGTNQNWTDVAQHFDMPTLRSTVAGAEVDNVKLSGFRMRIAVQQTIGALEDITYEVYQSDANQNPIGSAIHTGTFTPASSGNQDIVFGSEVEINGANGYLISFKTYAPGSDIFVLANSYCVVAGAANDGRGERRTRVKSTASGSWSDILESGPAFSQDAGEDQFLLDCDLYVFPFLSITEKEEK